MTELSPSADISQITAYLVQQRDPKLRDFNARLLPGVPPESILGIRMLVIRAYAKELHGTELATAFLATLPHTWFEENALHGALIDLEKDFDEALRLTEAYLPYVNNWANCDSFAPKSFTKNLSHLEERAQVWMNDEHEYTVRYGIGIFMQFFLGEHFRTEQAERIARVTRDEYYIKMMVAWYFATALAKQEETILPMIRARILEPWTHRKAVQKAIESRRIRPKLKELLRQLR